MAINTPYLTGDVSSQSNINTPYLQTGVTGLNSDVSSTGTSFIGGNEVLRGTLNSASAASFGGITGTTGTLTSTLTVGGAATLSSTLTVGGLTTFTSAVTVVGALNVNSQHTQATFLSYQTTASATSLIIPDGAFGVYFVSATSCRLCFRSGVTTYTVLASTGAVL